MESRRQDIRTAGEYGCWLGGQVGGLVWIIRWTCRADDPTFEWPVFWVGAAERGVTTSLTIWHPDSVKWFIGAWVAAKLAAGWKTKPHNDKNRLGHLIALVGNAIAFSFAIGIGRIFLVLTS